MPATRRTIALIAVAVVSLGLGACSGDDDADDAGTTVTTAVPTTAAATATESTDTTDTTATAESTTTTEAPSTSSTESEADLAALRDAYRQGYTQMCQSIWSLSPSGRMSDPEDPEEVYLLDDCLSELDDTTGEIYWTPEEAFEGGQDDAGFTADSFTFSGVLCSETSRCWEY